jgi:mRNA interferase RelE/StbE
VAPAAAKALRKIPPEVRGRITDALLDLADRAGRPRRIAGKSVKTIHGVGDSFHRLRVGDYRVMYDAIDEDRVILVLGVVHRGDLERRLRNR